MAAVTQAQLTTRVGGLSRLHGRTQQLHTPRVFAPLPVSQPLRKLRSSVVVSAKKDVDFDAVLEDLANKFEASENKPVVIGYGAAAVFAIFFAEWLIHLPALDVLIGFPIQFVGLLLLPYLGVRYLVDNESITDDAKGAVSAIVKKLPGLDGK